MSEGKTTLPTPPKRKRRVWGCVFGLLRVTLVLLVSCVLLVGAVILMRQRFCVQALEEQIAQIRNAGEPLTAEELAAYYRVPTGETDVERNRCAVVSTTVVRES